MRTLRIRTLVGLFAVAAVLSWAGAKLWDSVGTLPGVPVAAPIVLALIAAALFATALSLRARLRAQRERRPGAKAVDPLAAARAVVFGQASALVASLVVGMYGGTGVYLVMYKLDMDPRRDQAIYAGCRGPGGHRGGGRGPLPGTGLQAARRRQHTSARGRAHPSSALRPPGAAPRAACPRKRSA